MHAGINKCINKKPVFTHQSRIMTRFLGWASSTASAASATLEKKQKPAAEPAHAWWPGGRTTAKAREMGPSPEATLGAGVRRERADE